MKTVITYGTFDMFHIGHLRLIQRLKSYGTRIIVAVSSDDFNRIKGKKVFFPYQQRKEIIANIKGVDLVIPEINWEQKIEDIKKHKVDVFIMGDDWEGKFDFLKEYCEVVYLPRTKNISTSQIKQSINQMRQSNQSKGQA